MAEARLFHQVEADRWEAIPERDVVRGVIDDVGVRILVDESSVAVGFVVDLAQLDRGFAVTIALGWWFSMWGMWFTITRGDGLVLADLPVRRGSTEIVPNAFPVRPGDVRATMRRGPRTGQLSTDRPATDHHVATPTRSRHRLRVGR
ncbi:MAG: hypothetical protein EBY07_07815 [Actinobacteria bacterium]|nr:hypothetical protein [Actinomycetota bacterium]